MASKKAWWLTAFKSSVALLAIISIAIFSHFTQAAQIPEVDIALRVVEDGSAPYDGTTYDVGTGTNGGTDANGTNGVIRVLDYVNYRAEISINGTDQQNTVVTINTDEDQEWTKLPNECLTSTEQPGISPSSSISSDKHVLICNLGNKAQGTKLAIEPIAQVKGDALNATISDNTICSAIPSGNSLDSSGGCISAFATAESDTASEVTSKYVSVLTTAHFRVNLSKSVPINPVTGYYQPTSYHKAGPVPLGIGNGQVIDWIVQARAVKGSERVRDNGSGTRDFVLTDTFVDNNPNNNVGLADGSSYANRSSNARLYSWDSNVNPCESLGSEIGSITCTQATGDGANATDAGSPITITLSDVDVNYPDVQGRIFYFKLRLWVPIAEAAAPNNHDIMSNTGQCTGGICEVTVTNSITGLDIPNPSIDGASPVITSITGQQNYNGTGEPAADNSFDAPLTNATGTGGSADKAYYGYVSFHPGTKTAARGQIVPKGVTINLVPNSEIDKALVCDPLDTSQITFVGTPADGETHDVANLQAAPGGVFEQYNAAVMTTYPEDGKNIWESNPTLFYSTQDVNTRQFLPVSQTINDKVRFEYTDVAHSNALNDLRTYSCNDDLDGDSASDWVSDYNSLPGGASSVTAVRMVWDEIDWDEILGYYTKASANNVGTVAAQGAYNVRINPSATGYNCTGCSPAGNFVVDYTIAKFTAGTITNTFGALPVTTDTTNPDFSRATAWADRMRLVGAKTAITTELADPSQKNINAGDNVTFKVTPYLVGTTGSPVDVNVLQYLPSTVFGSPSNMSYVSAEVDPTCSTNNGTYGNFAEASGIVGVVISGVTAGQPICPFLVTMKAPTGANPGSYLTGSEISTSDTTINNDSLNPLTGTNPRSYSSVQILAVDGYRVQKDHDRENYEPNEVIEQNLVYSNLGSENYTEGNFIDVLPYNGDDGGFTSREDTLTPDDSRGSEYAHADGGATPAHVGLASLPTGTNGETFSYTTTNPSTIPIDPCHSANQPLGFTPSPGHYCYQAYLDNGNQFVDGAPSGTGIVSWSSSPPADLSDVTAVRWDSTPHGAGDPARSVSLSLAPAGNQDGDIYCNNFGGRIPQIALNVISNDICERVVSGTIAGTVFSDANASGGNYADNAGDGTYQGIEIELLDENGNLYDLNPTLPGVQPYSVATNANGQYSFTNLPSGDYQVRVATPPTTEQAYDLDDNSPPIPAAFTTPNNSGPVTLTGPAVDPDLADVSNRQEVDFSYTGTASLAGKVWQDRNKDGQQEPGEEFISGIPVHLLHPDGSAVTNPSTGEPWIIPTDSTGNFLFEDIPPGNYRVRYELPAGSACTVQHQGATATDSDGNPGTNGCMTDTITVLAGDNVINVDLGIIPGGSQPSEAGGATPNAPDSGIPSVIAWVSIIGLITLGIVAGSVYVRSRLTARS